MSLGRELYRWLDGDEGWLGELRDDAGPAVRLRGAHDRARADEAASALLQAPWELLADDVGFLAADALLRFAPARRIGKPAALAPDGFRLGIAFMASAPRGASELDYEAEETAIFAAAREGIDLFVEDSGDPQELGRRLAALENGPPPVLHLSCHGHNGWKRASSATPQPVLLMEDEAGNERPTSAAELVDALGSARPHVLFLSACLTAVAAEPASRGAVTDPLAAVLVGRAGVPAVVGWDGSVADAAATAFARVFYERLAKRWSVAEAAAAARRHLLGDSVSTAPDVPAGKVRCAAIGIWPECGSAGRRSAAASSPAARASARCCRPTMATSRFWPRSAARSSRSPTRRCSSAGGASCSARCVRSPTASTPACCCTAWGERASRAWPRGSPTAGPICGWRSCSVPTTRSACWPIWRTRWPIMGRRANCCRPGAPRCATIPKRCTRCWSTCWRGRAPAAATADRCCCWSTTWSRCSNRAPSDTAFARPNGPWCGPSCAPSIRRAVTADCSSRAAFRSRCPRRSGTHLEPRRRSTAGVPVRRLAEAAAPASGRGASAVRRRAVSTRPPSPSGLPLLLRTQELAGGNPGLQDLIGDKLVLRGALPTARVEAVLDQVAAYRAGGDLPADGRCERFWRTSRSTSSCAKRARPASNCCGRRRFSTSRCRWRSSTPWRLRSEARRAGCKISVCSTPSRIWSINDGKRWLSTPSLPDGWHRSTSGKRRASRRW